MLALSVESRVILSGNLQGDSDAATRAPTDYGAADGAKTRT